MVWQHRQLVSWSQLGVGVVAVAVGGCDMHVAAVQTDRLEDRKMEETDCMWLVATVTTCCVRVCLLVGSWCCCCDSVAVCFCPWPLLFQKATLALVVVVGVGAEVVCCLRCACVRVCPHSLCCCVSAYIQACADAHM